MAAKWADYLVSAVKFNVAETHIIKLRAHIDNGDTVSAPLEMDREFVISRLKSGTTFATIYQNSNGTWKFGAQVGIVTINGVEYIRTHSDGTTVDNLDDLPRFV